MELTKDRLNEIAYALLLMILSKEESTLDPERLKRNICNIPQKLQHLPENFRSITPEEIQAAGKIVYHDLVDYAFGFDLKKRRESKKK